ncbi:MAG: hypothetical protein JRN42_06220 [Nitrososphaerota archaeon]|nr:hypothetical protein [Nitrososphaerota archaeon]
MMYVIVDADGNITGRFSVNDASGGAPGVEPGSDLVGVGADDIGFVTSGEARYDRVAGRFVERA